MYCYRHKALIAQNTMMPTMYNSVAINSILWVLGPIQNFPFGATAEAAMCVLSIVRDVSTPYNISHMALAAD